MGNAAETAPTAAETIGVETPGVHETLTETTPETETTLEAETPVETPGVETPGVGIDETSEDDDAPTAIANIARDVEGILN